MARNTDVGGRALAGLWRVPVAGGRSLDSWFDERTERLLNASLTVALAGVTDDPRVVEALRAANLADEERT